MLVHCGGHQDNFTELIDLIVVGEIYERGKILYKIVEGGSDQELSDEENDDENI